MNEAEAIEFIKEKHPDQPRVWAAYLKARNVLKGTNKISLAVKEKARMD